MPRSATLKKQALRSLGQLPPFSPILTHLLASLASEDVSFSKLGDLIEKDAVLSGNVLQLVNSSLYGRRGTVNSVRHALSLLGINKLRNAVLGVSITRMWNQVRTPPSWSMLRFNLHSGASAILSDLLAQSLPVSYPEGAFVAGLLHDIGRLLIALSLPDEFGRILKLHEDTGNAYEDCERTLLGFTHSELSADALGVWNLPQPIQTAVRDHHNPLPEAGGGFPLSRVVDAANQYVNSRGISILETHRNDGADPAVIDSLGLRPDRLAALLIDFRKESDAMAEFLR